MQINSAELAADQLFFWRSVFLRDSNRRLGRAAKVSESLSSSCRSSLSDKLRARRVDIRVTATGSRLKLFPRIFRSIRLTSLSATELGKTRRLISVIRRSLRDGRAAVAGGKRSSTWSIKGNHLKLLGCDTRLLL